MVSDDVKSIEFEFLDKMYPKSIFVKFLDVLYSNKIKTFEGSELLRFGSVRVVSC